MAAAGWLERGCFDANLDQISVEVRAILQAKGLSRKRFRVLALYEVGTSFLLGEVLRTSFGPVFVYRTHTRNIDGRISNFRLRDEPLMRPLTGNADEWFRLGSESTQYLLRGRDLTGPISRGDTKLLIDGAFASRRVTPST
ncbi:hypothetical protein ACXYX3_11305 [Mycobacterium sp. C3-094]